MKDLFFVRRHRQNPCFFLLYATSCRAEGLWVTFCPQISSSYCTYIARWMARVKILNWFSLEILGNSYNALMPRDESTKIASDGLRYKSKEAGSPFSGSSSMGTMSCYKCGVHKLRSLGSFRKLAGQNMFCCGECHQPK